MIFILLLPWILLTEGLQPISKLRSSNVPLIVRSLQKSASEYIARAGTSKFDDFEAAADSLSPLFIRTPSTPLLPLSFNEQLWQNSYRRDSPSSGWFGFNHFIPRSARNFPTSANRKARSSYLLGESSQLHPVTNIRNSHHTDELDLDIAMKLRQLQQNLRLLPQQEHFKQPHFVLMEQAIKLPTGFLVPAVRNHQQNVRPRHSHSPNNNPRHSHNPNTDNPSHSRRPNDSPAHSNYNPSSNNHLRKSASALTPVTIKILPLKLTSIEIANALKSVSFMPIPLDFLNIKGNGGESDSEDKPIYNDRDESQPGEGWNDEEEDLPPPSSHVATPQDKPLGITYAEGQISERYINRYHPRK